jgi:hypothetical protein
MVSRYGCCASLYIFRRPQEEVDALMELAAAKFD